MTGVATNLTLDSLRDLAEGNLLAIRYEDFCEASRCIALARRLRSHVARSTYANGAHIGRIGMSYFEATTEEARNKYYDEAAHSLAALRAACDPHLYPIDEFRNMLSSIWPGGTRIATVEQREMFFGLVRIVENGPGARPHQDVLAWDAPPGCAGAGDLLAQLSANIYLSPADEGGELEIWDLSLNRERYEATKLAGTVALDRSQLPPPRLTLLPKLGELILLRSTNIHSVAEVTRGTRITASTFIGVRSEANPLVLWS